MRADGRADKGADRGAEGRPRRGRRAERPISSLLATIWYYLPLFEIYVTLFDTISNIFGTILHYFTFQIPIID